MKAAALRLPDPSPPPWHGRKKPPHEFYRPIFDSTGFAVAPPAPLPVDYRAMLGEAAAVACAGLGLIGATLPADADDGEIDF